MHGWPTGLLAYGGPPGPPRQAHSLVLEEALQATGCQTASLLAILLGRGAERQASDRGTQHTRARVSGSRAFSEPPPCCHPCCMYSTSYHSTTYYCIHAVRLRRFSAFCLPSSSFLLPPGLLRPTPTLLSQTTKLRTTNYELRTTAPAFPRHLAHCILRPRAVVNTVVLATVRR